MKVLNDEECQKLWKICLFGMLRYNPEFIQELKRPFGNSDWEDDVIEITKKKFTTNDEDELSDMKWDYGNQAMKELIEWAKRNADRMDITFKEERVKGDT